MTLSSHSFGKYINNLKIIRDVREKDFFLISNDKYELKMDNKDAPTLKKKKKRKKEEGERYFHLQE